MFILISLLPLVDSQEQEIEESIGLDDTLIVDIQPYYRDAYQDYVYEFTFDMSYSPNGSYLAVSNGGYVDIINTSNHDLIRTIEPPYTTPEDNYWHLGVRTQFSPDGEQLIVGRRGGETRVFNTTTWSANSGPSIDWLNSMAYSPDSEILALGGNEKIVAQIQNGAQSVNQIVTYPTESSVQELHFSKNGSVLMAVSGVLEFIDTDSWESLGTFQLDDISLYSCSFAKHVDIVYCAGKGGIGEIIVISYDLNTQQIINQKKFDAISLYKLAINPEGTKLAISTVCEPNVSCLLILNSTTFQVQQNIIVSDYLDGFRMSVEYSPSNSDGELASLSFRTLQFWTLDSDSDGWSDSAEKRCETNHEDINALPYDEDYDAVCDDIDEFDNRLLIETSFPLLDDTEDPESNDEKEYSFWSFENFKQGFKLLCFTGCFGIILLSIGSVWAGESPFIAVNSVTGVLTLEEPAEAGVILGMIGVGVFIFSIWTWISATISVDFDSIWWKICCGISLLIVIMVGVGLSSE